MKQCSKCKDVKPYTDFYKSKSSKDTFHSYCKKCCSETAKINNKLKRAERLAKNKEWKKLNPEKVNAQNRRWRSKNPDKTKKYTQNYREKNPEVVSINNHKRRDYKINNGSFEVTKSFMRKLYLSCCIKCGSKNQIQADHIIPLSRGGRDSEGNLQPLCKKCNLDKRAMTMTEWNKAKNNPSSEPTH